VPAASEAVSAADGAAALPHSRAELLRTTWVLAWPAIVSFSLESIAGLCDLLMVGRLGPTAVAAVGLGVQILSAVNAVMFCFGIGALAIVARQVGAGDRRGAAETLRQAIIAAAIGASIAVLPAIAWAEVLVGLFRSEPAVVIEAARFLRVLLLCVPGAAVVFVVAASLRGAGDMRTPLVIGAVTTVLNVAADYVLIFGRLGLPALGVAGAGTATALAFTVGAVLGLALLSSGRLELVVRWRHTRLRPDVVRRVLRIGYPAALEMLLMQIGFFIYVVFVARYGTGPMAAYFIGARVLALSFLPGLGCAAAASALVGQSLGAGRPHDAERGGWASMHVAIAIMSAAGLTLLAAARPIATLFVGDPVVVDDAAGFIRVLALCQPLMAIDFTMGGALRGAGDTRFPLLTVAVAFYAVRLGLAWVVTHPLGLSLQWLWRVVIGDFVTRAVLKSWRFRSGAWTHARV
jgi:putative MATE family efflux protein